MGVPLAAMRGWLFGLVAITKPEGKMLRAEPVSTRKYFFKFESKTWRSALLTPADKLFTVDRRCRFPDPKWGAVFAALKTGGVFAAPKTGGVFLSPKRCETCRAGDKISPDHQTLSGTYISQGEVAIVDLIWGRNYVAKDFELILSVEFTCELFESWETSMILSASFARSLMSVLSDRARICRTSGGSCARKNALTNVAGSALRLRMC